MKTIPLTSAKHNLLQNVILSIAFQIVCHVVFKKWQLFRKEGNNPFWNSNRNYQQKFTEIQYVFTMNLLKRQHSQCKAKHLHHYTVHAGKFLKWKNTQFKIYQCCIYAVIWNIFTLFWRGAKKINFFFYFHSFEAFSQVGLWAEYLLSLFVWSCEFYYVCFQGCYDLGLVSYVPLLHGCDLFI